LYIKISKEKNIQFTNKNIGFENTSNNKLSYS